MAVVSVDLAQKSYCDVGVVTLRKCEDHVCGVLVAIPIDRTPTASEVAAFLNQHCERVGARILLLDGPQAWKAGQSPFEYSRCCEHALNTPAKTGPPGSVKPAPYLGFVTFSIDVFDALCKLGWVRLTSVGSPLGEGARVVIESFPLSAWRSLDIEPLPAKRKTKSADLEERLAGLSRVVPLRLSGCPTHDQLQAVVAGLAGLAIEMNAWDVCHAAGVPPFVCQGNWREGFIVNVTPRIREALFSLPQASGIPKTN